MQKGPKIHCKYIDIVKVFIESARGRFSLVVAISVCVDVCLYVCFIVNYAQMVWVFVFHYNLDFDKDMNKFLTLKAHENCIFG